MKLRTGYKSTVMVFKGEDDTGNVGLIFNIQRFSVHDGPGIRDLVFLKGCPLRCRWCSNPESQHDYPEIAYNRNRCIGAAECGLCQKICPVGAVQSTLQGKPRIDRRLCDHCGKCTETCPAKALTLFGTYFSVNDVLKIVEEDSSFYSRSDGGITISGGEPMLQAGFVEDLLKKCQRRGIDTAIETTGYGQWDSLKKISRFANLIFYDIKSIDPEKHKKFTGVRNELILKNLQKLSHHFPNKPIIVRTPITPGINDSEQEIAKIAQFLTRIPTLQEYELLPYHGFGQSKYHQLGRRYLLGCLKPPDEKQMTALKDLKENILAR